MNGVAALVINFNTAALTLRCVRSLLAEPEVAVVHVLDNGSRPEECAPLRAFAAVEPRLRLLCSTENLGFAAGSNLALDELMADASLSEFLLLNSDAELQPGGLNALRSVLDPANRVALAGGRVLKPDGRVDSLGIAFYASCLASNRVSLDDRFFGPTGGCALYHRSLIEALRAAHGYLFDADFFCYAEDTDLAARALLLGFAPAYTDMVVALHEGQASSGGGFNDFVLYHGIRNSIWMLVKSVPLPLLLSCAPLIGILHLAIALRHGWRGKSAVVWRLYRDALRGVPTMWRKRQHIERRRTCSATRFAGFLTLRFYESDYFWTALVELFWRRARRQS